MSKSADKILMSKSVDINWVSISADKILMSKSVDINWVSISADKISIAKSHRQNSISWQRVHTKKNVDSIKFERQS